LRAIRISSATHRRQATDQLNTWRNAGGVALALSNWSEFAAHLNRLSDGLSAA